MQIKANGIHLEAEDSGADGAQNDRPVVLLIMGLGMQLIHWPQGLVQALLDAGYRVIRFDNRDAGLSQNLSDLGAPKLFWEALKLRLGLQPWAPYRLHDMAADALGLLDALGIERAHVVGASMGGMIAQRLAVAAPARVLSLTSIMSSSGARHLPQPEPQVLKIMLSAPSSKNPEVVASHYLKLFKAIGSPAYPVPDADRRQDILAGLARGYNPVGTLRQMMAVAADVDRATDLPRIKAPTLVLHGRADPLVPYPCGEDTARRIPGARMVGIDGMGHDFPPGVMGRLLSHLLPHLKAASPVPVSAES